MTIARTLLLAVALLAPGLGAAQAPPPADGTPPVAPPKKKTILVPVPAAPGTAKPAVSPTPGAAPTEPAPGTTKPAVPEIKELPAEGAPAEGANPPAAEGVPAEGPGPSYAPDSAPPAVAAEAVPEKPKPGAVLDGHLREGAFLSGPGSMAFVLHHTLMLGLGGLATQITWSGSNLALSQREALLAGALIGAGVGFGFSAWWQFNHWIDEPVANFTLVDSAIGGMFFAGLAHLVASSNPALVTWSAVIGSELGAWLTTVIGGGEMPLNQGVFIASGAYWSTVYMALILAVIKTSGTGGNPAAAIDALLLAPGVGAGALALALMRYNPTTAQTLRADVFGTGVGLAVLALSGIVLGNFTIPTPYVLSLLTSAGAIAAVSILWEAAAERPQGLFYDPERHRPYSNVWW